MSILSVEEISKGIDNSAFLTELWKATMESKKVFIAGNYDELEDEILGVLTDEEIEAGIDADDFLTGLMKASRESKKEFIKSEYDLIVDVIRAKGK